MAAQLRPKSADLVAGSGGRSEVGRVVKATDEDQRSASPSKISHGHLLFLTSVMTAWFPGQQLDTCCRSDSSGSWRCQGLLIQEVEDSGVKCYAVN